MGVIGELLGGGAGWLGEQIFGKTRGIDGAEFGRGIGGKIIPFARGGYSKMPGRKRGGRTMAKKRGGRK